ncbi:MAG: cytochrome c [Oligoflexia bacterium]|nr:cytochrome c [Oligoflexia bacterium]
MRSPLHAVIFSVILSGTLATGCSTVDAGDTGSASSASGPGDTSSGAAASGSSASGSSLYAASCANCHGADAMGGVGPAVAGVVDSNRVIDIIINGGATMPGFGASLSDAEIADILAYLGGL